MFENKPEISKLIQVIIVDDHGIIRDSLKRMLDTYEDINVIGTAANGNEAVELVTTSSPDVVLMDAIMPICNGVEGTRLIKEHDSTIKVLMLTTFSDKELIYNAFDAGIDGYVLKDITADKLVSAIHDAVSGELIIPTSIAAKLVQQLHIKNDNIPPKFNKTEDEIIELLVNDYSNKEIAAKLNISYGTTRNYISDIYRKVAESNRDQAIEKLRKYIHGAWHHE